MEIREARSQDHDFIVHLTEREIVPYLETAWDFKWDRNHRRKFQIDLAERGEAWIAREADRAAGFVWLIPMQRGTLLRRPVVWLNYMAVEPGYRGTGLGRGLLARSFERGVHLGCGACELWVQADNEKARRFYKRAGFHAVSHEGGNIRMRRPLADFRRALDMKSLLVHTL